MEKFDWSMLWETYTRKEVGTREGKMGQRKKFTCFVDADKFLAVTTGSSGAEMVLKICLKLRQGKGTFIFCYCLVIGHRSASVGWGAVTWRGQCPVRVYLLASIQQYFQQLRVSALVLRGIQEALTEATILIHTHINKVCFIKGSSKVGFILQ